MLPNLMTLRVLLHKSGCFSISPLLAWDPAFPNLLSYQRTITFQLQIFAVIDSSSILFGPMGLNLFAISLHCLFRALHEGRKVSMFSLLSLTRRPTVVLGSHLI